MRRSKASNELSTADAKDALANRPLLPHNQVYATLDFVPFPKVFFVEAGSVGRGVIGRRSLGNFSTGSRAKDHY